MIDDARCGGDAARGLELDLVQLAVANGQRVTRKAARLRDGECGRRVETSGQQHNGVHARGMVAFDRVTRERWIQIATVIGLVALVVWSFAQRWEALVVSPFPLGVDGFYYPIQLRALLDGGSLHYPASPMTFWFMAPFAAATDPITGAKLGAALGGALVALPAYAVGARIATQRSAGLVAAALATTSATSGYLSMEFVKQGFGLTVALTAIWLVLRALETPSRRRIGIALAGIVAAALTHKLAAIIVIAIATPAAFEEARARGVIRGRRLLYLLVAGGAVLITVAILGIASPERFLSPTDVSLLRDLVTSETRWDAPALQRPGLTLMFHHEPLLAGITGIAAIVALALRRGPARRSARVVGYGFALLGIVIALPWLDVGNTQGLGFRLRICAFVPLAVCGAIVAGALATFFAGWHRDAVLAALAVVLVARARPSHEGRIVAHPALVSAVIASTTHIPAGSTVIVPERHILFMVAWYTRAPVSLRPEATPRERRTRMLPLHFIGMGSPLDQALDRARQEPSVPPPIGVHARHRNGLVLVSEPTWDWLMAALPANVRRHWARWPTI